MSTTTPTFPIEVTLAPDGPRRFRAVSHCIPDAHDLRVTVSSLDWLAVAILADGTYADSEAAREPRQHARLQGQDQDVAERRESKARARSDLAPPPSWHRRGLRPDLGLVESESWTSCRWGWLMSCLELDGTGGRVMVLGVPIGVILNTSAAERLVGLAAVSVLRAASPFGRLTRYCPAATQGRGDEKMGLKWRRHEASVMERSSVDVVDLTAPATPASAPTVPGILDEYVRGAPTAQTAIDLFKGEWSSALPATLGVDAGSVGLFEDDRIIWLLAQTQIDGARVLELGPLEAGHTYQLTQAGAQVTAVEANTRAYLKCLIVKELLEVDSCRFLLGDFVEYLQGVGDERFDMVLASGVLYHSTDPIRLLTLLGGVTDQLAIWTHYFDETIVRATPVIDQHFQMPARTVEHEGRTLTLHPRHYLESLQWGGFCGGPETSALWMEQADLLAVLESLGFDDIRIGGDNPDHVNGPSILLYARRR